MSEPAMTGSTPIIDAILDAGVGLQPYAPVRVQLLNIWRAVNRARQAAGFDRVPIEALPWRRSILRPLGGTVASQLGSGLNPNQIFAWSVASGRVGPAVVRAVGGTASAVANTAVAAESGVTMTGHQNGIPLQPLAARGKSLLRAAAF